MSFYSLMSQPFTAANEELDTLIKGTIAGGGVSLINKSSKE